MFARKSNIVQSLCTIIPCLYHVFWNGVTYMFQVSSGGPMGHLRWLFQTASLEARWGDSSKNVDTGQCPQCTVVILRKKPGKNPDCWLLHMPKTPAVRATIRGDNHHQIGQLYCSMVTSVHVRDDFFSGSHLCFWKYFFRITLWYKV